MAARADLIVFLTRFSLGHSLQQGLMLETGVLTLFGFPILFIRLPIPFLLDLALSILLDGW